MTPKGSLAAFALDLTEKQVESQCDQLMKSLGWSVIRFSQPRNTMQTLGIPDRRYYPPDTGDRAIPIYAFWMEVKREGGKQSPHQAKFQAVCEAAGDNYVLGGVAELVKYLNDAGISKMRLNP